MNNVVSGIQWGPSKRWSVGKYQLQYWDKNRRAYRNWAFQIGGVGSEANNPVTAIIGALKFNKKLNAEMRTRQSRGGLTPEQYHSVIRKLNE